MAEESKSKDDGADSAAEVAGLRLVSTPALVRAGGH